MKTDTTALHECAAYFDDGTVASVRRYAIAWLHQARLSRGLAREYAAVRLGGIEVGTRGALWAPHARPEALRLARRLRAVSDRLIEISGDEPEGRDWI